MSPRRFSYLGKSVEVVETRGGGGDLCHAILHVDGTARVPVIHVAPSLLANSIQFFSGGHKVPLTHDGQCILPLPNYFFALPGSHEQKALLNRIPGRTART